MNVDFDEIIGFGSVEASAKEYNEKIEERRKELEELEKQKIQHEKEARAKIYNEASLRLKLLEEKVGNDRNYLVPGVERIVSKIESQNRVLNEYLRLYADSTSVLQELKKELEALINEKEQLILDIKGKIAKAQELSKMDFLAVLKKELEEVKYDIDFYQVILEDVIVELSATEAKKDATNGSIRNSIERIKALKESKLFDMTKRQSDLNYIAEYRKITSKYEEGHEKQPNLENTAVLKPVSINTIDLTEKAEEPENRFIPTFETKKPSVYDAEANQRRIQEIIDSIDNDKPKEDMITGTIRISESIFGDLTEVA